MKDRLEKYDHERKKKELLGGCLSFALLIAFTILLVMIGAIRPKKEQPEYVERVFCIKKNDKGKPIFALIDSFKKEELEGLEFKCITRKLRLNDWHYIYLHALKHEVDVRRALSPVE